MSRGARRLRTWAGRIGLFLVSLELCLRFVPLPSWWEAGVWRGNILTDRAWVQVMRLLRGPYNHKGYRDHPREAGPEPMLVAMGDSRVYGHYVSPAQAFPQVMDATTDWEVANLGMPGASVVEANDFIVEDALELEPEAAVLLYDVNSSLIGLMSREEGGARGDWGLQLARSSALLRWLELGLRAAFVERHPVMSVERYEELLVQLLDRLAEGGVTRRVVLVGWTELDNYPGLYTQDRYEQFRAASRDAAHRAGARTVEMEALFSRVPHEKAFVGHERMHLTPWGHEELARALARALGPPP